MYLNVVESVGPGGVDIVTSVKEDQPDVGVTVEHSLSEMGSFTLCISLDVSNFLAWI